MLDSNKYVTPAAGGVVEGTALAGGSLDAGMNAALSPEEIAAMTAAGGGKKNVLIVEPLKENDGDGLVLESL